MLKATVNAANPKTRNHRLISTFRLVLSTMPRRKSMATLMARRLRHQAADRPRSGERCITGYFRDFDEPANREHRTSLPGLASSETLLQVRAALHCHIMCRRPPSQGSLKNERRFWTAVASVARHRFRNSIEQPNAPCRSESAVVASLCRRTPKSKGPFSLYSRTTVIGRVSAWS